MSEEFTEVKPWWQSRTVIGALVAVLASFFGGLDAAAQAELADVAFSVVAATGAAVALAGRYFAKSKLKLK